MLVSTARYLTYGSRRGKRCVPSVPGCHYYKSQTVTVIAPKSSNAASTLINATLYKRNARPQIVEALRDTRVVHLAGARQVGKSTLVRSIAQNEHPSDYVTLDDQATRVAADRDPNEFVASFSRPVVIDEIQRVPDLLLSLKRRVDQDNLPGQFLITGSANLLNLSSVSDALTGRMETIMLRPLSAAERMRRTSVNLIDRVFEQSEPLQVTGPAGYTAYRNQIELGGFPEAVNREPNRRSAWFRNYLDATVLRDITEFAAVEKASELPRLVRLLAAQDANLLSSNEIAKKLGIDHKTVSRYIGLLETAFIVERVRAWKANLGNREVSRPKLHFCDSGLLAYLLGVRPSQPVVRHELVGQLFETFVYNEFRKLADWSESEPQLFHYRDQRNEVDLVIERPDGAVIAVEIKSASTLRNPDLRGLEFLRDRLQDRFVCGLLVYTGEQTLKLGDRVWAIPAQQLWQ